MILEFSAQARKQLKKLTPVLKKKAYKSFNLLIDNYRHPSLRSKRMAGSKYFEARIDYHNRFAYSIEGEIVRIHSIGPHDEGLAKK